MVLYICERFGTFDYFESYDATTKMMQSRKVFSIDLKFLHWSMGNESNLTDQNHIARFFNPVNCPLTVCL